ncbi:hypothetical protein SAVIM338S_02210 [Streptomyces avidinii]
MTYWDPMPTVRACATGEPLPGNARWVPAYSPPWGAWPDAWARRDWRNAPGPFYGAGTDTCWTGREVAPARVLYAYVAHIGLGLAGYLRGYLFRLEEGRPARAGEALPGL